MSVTNGFHPVRLSSLADELDEIDPRVRSQLVAPTKQAPPPSQRKPHKADDVDVITRGPDNPRGLEWTQEKLRLAQQGKRRCSHCRHVKDLGTGFPPSAQSWCRDCAAGYARDRYAAGHSANPKRKARAAKRAGAAAPVKRSAAAAPPATSKNVLQMIAKLRVIVEERDTLKSQVDRLRKERDQAVAELNQLLSDVANAIR